VVVNQLALGPSGQDFLELKFKVLFREGVRLLACKGTVEVVRRTEMVAILTGDDSELVVRLAGDGVDLGGQIIVPLRWSPIAVLLDELGFAITGQVAKLDERLVAGQQHLLVQVGGDVLAGGCFGS
jgi:hypothetical protein